MPDGRKQKGVTELRLNRPLRYNHYGRYVPDGFKGAIDERAEVALLTRNIVIRGSVEQGPHKLEGGHFIVFMTATPQQIEGVEFVNMGQQGTLGRYPIHFHVCADTRGRSIVRANSIHDSKQVKKGMKDMNCFVGRTTIKGRRQWANHCGSQHLS